MVGSFDHSKIHNWRSDLPRSLGQLNGDSYSLSCFSVICNIISCCMKKDTIIKKNIKINVLISLQKPYQMVFQPYGFTKMYKLCFDFTLAHILSMTKMSQQMYKNVSLSAKVITSIWLLDTICGTSAYWPCIMTQPCYQSRSFHQLTSPIIVNGNQQIMQFCIWVGIFYRGHMELCTELRVV